jgi:glycerol-3-phosphate acyltransferase PlsY
VRVFVAVDVGDAVRREVSRVVTTLTGKLEAVKTPPKVVWGQAGRAARHDKVHRRSRARRSRTPARVARAADRSRAVRDYLARHRHVPIGEESAALWLGVTNGAAPLAEIEAEVSRRIAGVNAVELDARALLPHLTLGRVKMAGAGVDWPKILQDRRGQARGVGGRSRDVIPQRIVAAGAALYWSGQRSVDQSRRMIPAILIGYAVGSLPIGYLVAQRAGGVDLRRVGSGNVGAANVYRTAGLSKAIAVMIADVAKGAAAVLIAGGGSNAVAAGVAAVVGHIYPVWLQFRGGKGVATAGGVFAVLTPIPTIAAAAAFALVVARTRFVSLGSIVATIVLPIVEWMTPGRRAVDIGATIVAALVLFRHRGNAVRLLSRTERAIGT